MNPSIRSRLHSALRAPHSLFTHHALRITSAACLILLAGTVWAPGAESRVLPENITQVAPGIWRIRIGHPEILTPTHFRTAPVDLEHLDQPAPAEMPLDARQIDFQITAGGCAVELPMKGDENVYGFGLNTKLFDMTQYGGRRVFLRPTDNPENDLGDSHAPVPFFASTAGYGVYADTARFVSFYTGDVAPLDVHDVQADAGNAPAATSTEELYRPRPQRVKTMLIQVPAAQGIDVYVFAGPAMKDAVQRYNLFSGGGCVPPLWGLGIQYRGYSRYGAEESLTLANRLRADHMPCDVWGVEPGWQTRTYSSSFVWNTNAFPDPDQFIQQMHAAGFHVNFWEHAFTHPDSPMYAALTNVRPSESFTIESKVLGESRPIRIYTPPGYAAAPSSRYPVLYLLDGGEADDFPHPHVALTIDEGIRAGELLPMIVVAIENTDRHRDMTDPTTVDADKRYDPKGKWGGASNFRAFIRNELVPAVSARWRTNGRSAIMGESLAGLFVIETLFADPTLFDTYISISPSLYWNDHAITRSARTWMQAHSNLKANVYLTNSGNDDVDEATSGFAKAVKETAPAGVTFLYEPALGETHASIYESIAPALLRKLFPAASRQK